MPKNLPNVIPLDSLVLGEGIDVIRHAHFINMTIINAVCAKNIVPKNQERLKKREINFQKRKEMFERCALKLADKQRREEIKNKENNDLNKEESEKLESEEKILQRNKEIVRFNEERANLFTKIGQTLLVFNRTSSIIMEQKLKDESEDKLEEKLRLRRENKTLIESQAVIKEEIQRKSDKISRTIMEQKDKVNELGLSIDEIPEISEEGFNRMREILDALIELLKAHKTLLKDQQKLKVEMADLIVKGYTDYFTEKLPQMKDKIKDWDFNQDIREQERSGYKSYENHQQQMLELHKHEQLVEKLSYDILTY